ncbi:M14 family zinc carboxypeptidase [Bacillus sp. D386]|uniref:M14 family zinc carboxypeptidase n=1 Tax=Bacillus sp. D386 TaxID=2587155 RepID=UPI00214A94D6|nr:M14 family zinc carboxypeptidase [Bacillus sp. D386]
MKRISQLIVMMLVLSLLIQLPGETKAASKTIVNPNKTYTYTQMGKDITTLKKAYPDLVQVKTIGASEYGRKIYAVGLGKGSTNVFINGSHHAREWLTTSLNMYMIEKYAAAYKGNKKISGYNAKSLLNSSTIWFVPMVNPDGVTLQQQGLKAFPKSTHKAIIKMNNGSKNFKRWKANAKGIDLNRQYKADWGKIKNSPKSPSYKNYKGKAPESTKEVKAVVKFVNQINPEMTVAYHSSGRILYWNYKQSKTNYNRDHVYAKKIGKMTGYSLVYPGKNPSGGGFSDWFISTKKRPSFTPEIGKPAGETNLPVSQFSQIWKENQGVGLYVAQESIKLKDARDKKSAATLKKDSAAKLKTAKKLEKYYYTDIKSTSNLKITDAHQKLYNTVTKDIKALQSKVNKLPSKHTKSIKADITAMKTYTSRSLTFMNAVKYGSTLQTADKAVVKMINDGIVSSKLPDSHKKLNQTITQMQKKVTPLYGKGARTLFTQKYVTPAKRTAEDTKYDVERYNLLVLIEGQVKENKFTDAQKNLNKLPALEKKSIDLKKKNLSKYPTYMKWENNFKVKIAELQKEVTDALTKAEEAAKKAEDQKRMEQEKEKAAKELKEQQAKENEKAKQQVREKQKANQLNNEKNRSSFDQQKPAQPNSKPNSPHNGGTPRQIVNN